MAFQSSHSGEIPTKQKPGRSISDSRHVRSRNVSVQRHSQPPSTTNRPQLKRQSSTISNSIPLPPISKHEIGQSSSLSVYIFELDIRLRAIGCNATTYNMHFFPVQPKMFNTKNRCTNWMSFAQSTLSPNCNNRLLHQPRSGLQVAGAMPKTQGKFCQLWVTTSQKFKCQDLVDMNGLKKFPNGWPRTTWLRARISTNRSKRSAQNKVWKRQNQSLKTSIWLMFNYDSQTIFKSWATGKLSDWYPRTLIVWWGSLIRPQLKDVKR